MLLRKQEVICCYIFPPHLINASTLPCETENTEIVSFSRKCCMLICQQTHKSHRNYHLITVGLFFIHKTIGCVHQTRPKKGTRHSATYFAHTYWSPYPSWCQDAWYTVSRMEVFLHQAWIACQWIELLRCSTILTTC